MFEISNDYFCSGSYDNCGSSVHSGCKHCHRKWPTLENFKEEYGEEYPEKGAVYVWHTFFAKWEVMELWQAKKKLKKKFGKDNCFYKHLIVCACTPWGKPGEGCGPE